jgi:hypothetical protein
MKPKSQKEALMLLLKKGQPINWVKAFTTTGCSKLSTRVAEFIQQGYKIKKERVNFTTRYKTHGTYVEYTLDVKKTPKKLLK